MMVKAFLDHGARVLAYDPLARESANFDLGGRALIMDTACDCLRDADVVLIATPDPEFKRLSARDFRANGRAVLVVDFWRILPAELAATSGIEYVPYGRGPAIDGHGNVLEQLWGGTSTHYGR